MTNKPAAASHARPETRAARIGVADDVAHGAVAPPLYASTTYVWPDAATKPAFDYGRTANPNRAQLAEALSALEGAAGGVITASGMAAIDVVLSLLRPGDLLLAPHDCYGGSHRLFSARASRGHFDVLFVDQTDLAAVDAAIAARAPQLIWIETPSNPVMRITDIEALVARGRAAGARVAADNTFLSPARQRPLALGCDIVVHSTTKYINGHSDVVGGAALARDAEVVEEFAWWANCAGLTGGAADAALTLRGLRTLFARMTVQEANAAALATFLQSHPGVEAVYYPGLVTHPGHAIAARQQSGFGAMASFTVRDGAAADAVLGALTLIPVAASLGGFETLACRPANMTHAGMDPDARRAAGVHEGLIRLSVGVEHVNDLQADLDRALSAIDAR